MAGGQQELDFGDAARLEAHLLRCGYSAVQAGLAALVLREGEKREIGGEVMSVLSLVGREAAERLGCTRQAVAKAAAVLQRHEWFGIARAGRRMSYVLDDAAARSLVPLDQRLDEQFLAAAAEVAPPAATGCNRVQPGATECNQVQPGATSSRVHEVLDLKNPCLPRSAPRSAPRLAAEPLPAVADGCTRLPCRRLPSELPMPWLRGAGVTDDELRAAVREENVELLGWMHDVAVTMGWIGGPPAAEQMYADGSWFRFLICAHHTATARGIPAGKRMACLVVRGQAQFDCEKTRQASDQWAGKMAGLVHRDPALAGRMMEAPDGE